MPEQKTIPQSEVDRLLEVEEGHYSDVKRIEIKPSKLSETVSAFANTSGGEIFVGIAEDKQKDGSTVRHWAGFINMEAANGILQVLEGMAALGNHYRATFLNSPGQPGHVLHLTVLKTRDILKASDGHPYVRRNAQNLRVDTDDGLRRLRLDKGIATFEDDTLNIPPKTITNSKHILEFVLQVVPSAEPEEWLASQFLIANDNPVVAGVLLFADEPQAALPKRSAIKIYRYKTREEEGTRETLAFDPITVEGCLYDQIASAVDGTKRLVEGIKRLGTKGLEDVVYPHETLHEVVTNAVLHRDYSIASDIQIRIYDNRIEVESPGKLPGHVTKANILTEQSARNPKIVRLINKFPNPPNKDVGEGLNTAFAAMEKLRLKAPEIEEAENSVVVRISHTPLASPEETVMEYLTGHDEITNGIGRELTGIRSENSMKEVFLRLKKRKLIEPVPGKKGKSSAWRKYTGAEFSGENDVDEDDVGEDEDSLVSDKIDRREYYITTAIAYPNGVPHIGHAYELIATDAIARFMRLDGRDVFFLTGTDEHGIKMLQTAAKENVTPRELVERNVPRFQAMAKALNASNDAFIRTTEPRHFRSSEAIWQRMQAAGDIYLDKYAGWYSVRDEAYYDESETRLDDKGQRLGPQGTPVEWVEEESYFFKLSAFTDRLLDLYKRVPDFVLPRERMNEVASFVRGGLKDLSLSRTTFDWGIKVPENPAHVMYVWVDALTNYITAVGYPDTDSAMFKKYWPADLHVIGKDIVRFHAVYWPAFLMSAGVAVPRRIFSHGFLFNRGEKMSKSVGNVIDPFALADAYGVDPLRYFLLREVPFGQDGNYSHEAIVNRINADLANDLGNLAQRSLTMVGRNLGGVLPAPGAYSANDQAILAAADAMLGKARDAMATQQLHQVLNAVWTVVADANRYFAGEAPWALAKTDPARQGTVLYVTAEVLRQIAILAQPFMPASAGKLLDLLAVPDGERTFAYLDGKHRLAAGAKLPAPTGVFPRYVEPGEKAAP